MCLLPPPEVRLIACLLCPRRFQGSAFKTTRFVKHEELSKRVHVRYDPAVADGKAKILEVEPSVITDLSQECLTQIQCAGREGCPRRRVFS